MKIKDKYKRRYQINVIKEKLVNAIVEYVLELPDEARTTTREIVQILDPSLDIMSIDLLDFLDIHNSMIEEVEKHNINLDFSEHYGKYEGLPWNLDFIVHNKISE